MTPSLKLMNNLYICDLSDEAFLYAFHFCVFLFLSVAVHPCVERMPIKRKTGLSNVSEANKKMVKTIFKIKKILYMSRRSTNTLNTSFLKISLRTKGRLTG